jgi:hypothetical protein
MSNTTVDAVIGALVNLLLAPVLPFAPVLGGAVSGYLQDGDRSDGLRVGALAGVLSAIALVVLFFIVGNLLLAVVTGVVGGPRMGPGMRLPGLGVAVLLVAVLVAGVYVVGLSALGGYLGVYLREEL